MKEDEKEVVADQKFMDEGEKDEEATTTKVKIEEKAQQQVMEEVARGKGRQIPSQVLQLSKIRPLCFRM